MKTHRSGKSDAQYVKQNNKQTIVIAARGFFFPFYSQITFVHNSAGTNYFMFNRLAENYHKNINLRVKAKV